MEMEREGSREMGRERARGGTVAPPRRRKHGEGKPMSKEEMGAT